MSEKMLVTQALDERDLLVKKISDKIEQCGEKFYMDDMAEGLEDMVNMAKKLMQEISVIDYLKVA